MVRGLGRPRRIKTTKASAQTNEWRTKSEGGTSMRESRTTEFKETVTNAFLKTVSAFANYDGGEIVFGVDDAGSIKGLSDARQACLDIENKINDSITPQPDYMLQIENGGKTIRLTVHPGLHKPYLYKSKAYRRNDTATIEVDALQLSRLVLEGKNLRFEELRSVNQDLTFAVLSQKLKDRLHIEVFSLDTLRTLNLYNNQSGYTNAAEILADENRFPGIDIAKFGEDINVIRKRATFDRMSVLTAYDKTLAFFRDYYQYEEIQGSERQLVELVPEAAFREAVANALIHRVWDVAAQIKISMFDDRIEIVSPGGLPPGITPDEYLSGKLSVLRNVTLSGVFYRLGLVEIFGTGIPRIKQLYRQALKQPSFEVSENTIKITLPVFEKNLNLSADELKVFQLLSKTTLKSMRDIVSSTDFGKSKVTRLLKAMHQKGVVRIEGEGRGTRYAVK